MSAYSGWMRNYKAMGDEKLRYALKELEGGYGDAFYRVQDKGGLIDEHIAEARAQARIRGMVEGNDPVVIPPSPEGTLGEAKECSDCGKRRRHYVDDYICKDCRDGLSAAPMQAQVESLAMGEKLLKDAAAHNEAVAVDADDLMAKLNEALGA